MTNDYDVVLVHPPSFYDFRRKPVLPGPIDRTVPIYTFLFIMFPIGMMSIASFIDNRGVKVKIFNLAEKVLTERSFKCEEFLRKLKSKIYAIDLHWSVHTNGAVEIAKLCKMFHPDSIVILGGLTATCFAEELVGNLAFVDGVIRGEAELPLYILFRNLEKYDKIDAFKKTPSFTFRTPEGEVVSTKMCDVADTLDELDFTRFDLVEPLERTITSPITRAKLWNIPFCRGCLLNCATCGGSRYSYRKLLKRDYPAFRSPRRIFEDFITLDELGVKSIFLFQDPRMAGEKYIDDLVKTFKGAKWTNIKNVGIELFWPASKTYLEKLKGSDLAENVGLSISPESGNDNVRIAHGRHYFTEDLIKTVDNCIDFGIPIGVFFMIALGHENHQTLGEMWTLWEELLLRNTRAHRSARVSVDFGPMILLDPGSPAFFNAEKYGYRLIFKNFLDYYRGLTSPHWKYWISYETMSIDRVSIGKAILDSWETLSTIKWKLGLLTEREYELESIRVLFEKTVYNKIDKIILEKPEEVDEICKELVEISKDPLLSWNYVLTNDTEI